MAFQRAPLGRLAGGAASAEKVEMIGAVHRNNAGDKAAEAVE